MTRVIGVRFRNVGKIYYFSPKNLEIKSGDHVIVETARGVEYGSVVLAPRDVEDEKVVQPLKEVIRIANTQDDKKEETNRKKEKEAFRICLKKIREHSLNMKLIDVEYTFDNNKILFYFTADGRIDFRELVKDLASIFKTRIELRQIGVRDETKILGGIGICGRPLCCHTYLSEFVPVSIKMAKEQNLSLNPTKISGVCGRLMCCLKNEEETYEELNKKLPNTGDRVTTSDGLKGEVQTVNVLRQLVKVIVDVEDEKEIQEYPLENGQTEYHTKGYDVIFDHVKFSYETGKTVLKDVSFTAKQGQVTALVGPSGGGKSTIAKLAAKFYDVDGGKITLGGADIAKIDPVALMKDFSIVFQDVVLFNNTIMENIRVGRKGASDEDVIAAAKAAKCHDFIEKLPQGYQTVIGENGSTLSGGECQRLSIARALLKYAPVILL